MATATTHRALPGPSWVPAGRRLKQWESIPIVEPVPRAPPKEIASGLSFREGDLPHARCLELVKVCDFYEAKASAKYVDSALCGRYLHAMAREVRALALALRDSERQRKRRVAELEAVCAEWDAHFAPRADVRGALAVAQGELEIVPVTPAALAAERASLVARIRDLEAQVASASDDARNGVQAARAELADYQGASRAAAERERQRRAAEEAARATAEDRARAAAAAEAARAQDAASRDAKAAHDAHVAAVCAELAAARHRGAAADAQVAHLDRALRAARAHLDEAERTTRTAIAEVTAARQLRRKAVDEALEAHEAARRAARRPAVATQATASSDVVVSSTDGFFSFQDDDNALRFLPCKRAGSEAMRSVLLLGDLENALGGFPPPDGAGAVGGGQDDAKNLRAVVDAISRRLGIALLRATRRSPTKVELHCATRRDAARLLEAKALPPLQRPKVITARKFFRAGPTTPLTTKAATIPGDSSIAVPPLPPPATVAAAAAAAAAAATMTRTTR